jgi:undecaprenyl-diphosphatase
MSTQANARPAEKADGPPYYLHVLFAVIVSIAAFFLFMLVREAVEDKRRGFMAFDRDTLVWMHGHQLPILTSIAKILAFLGSPTAMIGVAVLAIVIGIAYRAVRGASWTLPVAIVGAGIIIQVAKITFRRARPDLFVPLLHETGYSFPSGHSLISVVVYGLLGYFAQHLFRSRAVRTGIAVATIAFIALISISRVYVEVHYPTDVLAGWSLGVPWLFGCISLHRRLVHRYQKLRDPVPV